MLEGLIGIGLIGGALAFTPEQHSYEGRVQAKTAQGLFEQSWDATDCRERSSLINEATFHLGQARVHARGSNDRQLKIHLQRLHARWTDAYAYLDRNCNRYR